VNNLKAALGGHDLNGTNDEELGIVPDRGIKKSLELINRLEVNV
jgi:hypothetical protein